MKNLTIKAKLYIILVIGSIGSLMIGFTVNSKFWDIASQNPEIASALTAINWYIAVLLIVDATVVVYVVKQINTSVTSMEKGLRGFFNFLNYKTDKFDLIDIRLNDELGLLSKEINKEALRTQEILAQDKVAIDEAVIMAQRVENGFYNFSIQSTPANPSLIKLRDGLNSIMTTTQDALNSITKVLIAYANANYTHKIEDKYSKVSGSMGSIIMGVQAVGHGSSEILAIVTNAGNKMKVSNEEVSALSQGLSTSSNQQAASLEETAAALEEITSTVTSNNANIQEMAKFASQITISTKEGEDLANKTAESMEDIKNGVDEILEAINVIDQIAFQTNILSLNAAVEAATAGEAGKGFAVVAQEVRNLASRSADAANDIKALVDNAKRKADEGTVVSDKMIDGYSHLNKNIEKTIKLIDDVASSSKEQQSGIEQINDAVTELDQATQQNAAAASSMLELANQSLELSQSLLASAEKTNFKQETLTQVCDMDLVMKANSLKLDHINFKDNAFIQARKGHKFTVTTEHQCSLGKWLDKNKSTDFANGSYWTELLESHKNVHQGVQCYVDLVAKDSTNSEILSKAEFVEDNINKVFDDLNKLKDVHCKHMKDDSSKTKKIQVLSEKPKKQKVKKSTTASNIKPISSNNSKDEWASF